MKKNINFLLESGLGLTRNTLKLKINNDWIDVGSEVKNKLQKIICEQFHHVGSTAIKGLLSKPILDLLLIYSSSNLSEKTIQTIKEHGFTYKGDIISRCVENKD